MAAFIFLAALMLAAALAFVLTPLLRGGGARRQSVSEARRLLAALESARDSGVLSAEEYAAKRSELGERLLGGLDEAPAPASTRPLAFYSALAVALLLPIAAIVLYRQVGTPAALSTSTQTGATTPAPADHTSSMDQAIANLAARLKQNPKDFEGWALLGRAYEATQRFDQARDALKHAYELGKGDPDVAVAYAETIALTSASHRIEGEARRLIDEALKAAPDNQRGLWLLGIGEYQHKRYDAAIAAWQHLLQVVPKDSDIVASVQQQIDQAKAARDGHPATASAAANAAATPGGATPAAAAPATATSGGPHLTVAVSLDPKLKGKVSPDDVLFVYAKAANGPPMPLAIRRLPASKLPVTVTLTDGMGMVPSMKLSQFPQVIIGARVSKSGNAMPHSGDMQTLSAPLAVSTTKPIKLTIDQIVP